MMNEEDRKLLADLQQVDTNAFHLVWNMIWRCGDMSQHDKLEGLSVVVFAMETAIAAAQSLGGVVTRHEGGGLSYTPDESPEKDTVIRHFVRTLKYAEAAADDFKEHDVNVFDPLDKEGAAKLKSMKVLMVTQDMHSITRHDLMMLGEKGG
jgi:hypothetical protein